MKLKIPALLLVLLVVDQAWAQQPPRFDRYDGLLAGAMVGDELSTTLCRHCHEAGALKSRPARIAFKGALFFGLKGLEKIYSHHSTAFKVTKICITAGFTFVIGNNIVRSK